jgi:D-aminopeptidase
VRTGVTVIVPNDDIYNRKLISGGFILSGAGEVSGFTQLSEWGLIETPIALTNTMAVGRVSDGVVKWMAGKYPEIRDQQEVIIPVVGECDDSFLNDAVGLHIKPQHIFSALDGATGGRVEEGAVGAGTGMICCDFKGGIGTSSRLLTVGSKQYTIGVMVVSNFGIMEDLRMDGYPIGRLLFPSQGKYSRRINNYGSIIAVVATDLPLSSQQMNRVCRRAALGIGRVGSYGAHGSGEIIIGFSTANEVPHRPTDSFDHAKVMRDSALDPVYKSVIETTEESILNSLTTAVDMEGAGNNRVPALNLTLLRGLLEHYQSVQRLVDAKV